MDGGGGRKGGPGSASAKRTCCSNEGHFSKNSFPEAGQRWDPFVCLRCRSLDLGVIFGRRKEGTHHLLLPPFFGMSSRLNGCFLRMEGRGRGGPLLTFGSCLPVEVAVIALLDFLNLGKQRQEREAGRKAVKIYLCFFGEKRLKRSRTSAMLYWCR